MCPCFTNAFYLSYHPLAGLSPVPSVSYFHVIPTQIQQLLHEPVGDAIPHLTAPLIVVCPARLFPCWFDPHSFLQRRPFNSARVYNFGLLVHTPLFVLQRLCLSFGPITNLLKAGLALGIRHPCLACQHDWSLRW